MAITKIPFLVTKDMNSGELTQPTTIKDNNNKDVIRIYDSAPHAYDPEFDTLRTELSAGNDELGLISVLELKRENLLSEAIKIGNINDTQLLIQLTQNMGATSFTGAIIKGNDRFAYLLYGNFETKFSRYDMEKNTMLNLTDTPQTIIDGAGCYDGDDYIYVVRGNNNSDFLRYSIKNNNWSSMQALPVTGFGTTSLVYAGNDKIYAIIGNSAIGRFYEYSISSNLWNKLVDLPIEARNGQSMVYTGGDKIFVSLGSSSGVENKKLYSYSISLNTFTELNDAPENYNGTLVYTGANYIYVNRGFGTTTLYRYSINDNSWELMTNMRYSMYYGSKYMIYGNDGFLYCLQGNGTQIFFRLKIAVSNYQNWM